MELVSYAQNFEDIMLWRALKHIERGFYVDVGAASPVDDSVTKLFYDRGWCGINIEPNEKHFKELIEHRTRDLNLQVAIIDDSKSFEFFVFGDTGLSTIDSNIASEHRRNGLVSDQVKVQAMPLVDVLKKHFDPKRDIHFLKIDVEGVERKVLVSNDWNLYRPWIVVVEATYPNTQIETHEEWESVLESANYTFAYADGLNRFYVSNEHLDLLPAFKYPPNVFDRFKSSKIVFAEKRAAMAEERAKKAETKAAVAEEKASLAEAKAAALNHQLVNIENSFSWRVTKPLRLIKRVYKNLRQLIRTVLKKAVYSGIRIFRSPLKVVSIYVRQHPRLKQLVYRVLSRHPYLLQHLLTTINTQSHRTKKILGLSEGYDDTQLSLQARRYYIDLKEARDRQKR